LCAAIENANAAQRLLDEAQVAAHNATQRWFAANRKVDQLSAQIEEAAEQPPDTFIEALAGDLARAIADFW